MSIEATELRLFAENSGELYAQFKAICANLINRGTSYSPILAAKLWRRWFDRARKLYALEFGVKLGTNVAQECADAYASEWTHDNQIGLTPGQRVELHPGLDLWMRGARFGTVLRIRPDWTVRVKLDVLQNPVTIRWQDLKGVRS